MLSPTCHICVLPAVASLFLSVSAASLPYRAAAAVSRRRRYTSPFHTAAPSLTHAHAAVRLPPQARAAAAMHPVPLLTRARAANTPPVRSRHRVPPRRRQGQSRRPCTTRHPRSSTLHRSHSRSHSAFSLSARRVLDVLPEPLLALFSRRVRVLALPRHSLATASRDGSRKEEGEGGCCREARPQADSRRERG